MNPSDPIRNRRIASVSALLSPQEVRERLPLTQSHEELVRGSRDTVTGILDGRDDRLLVIVGPCSVHDPGAALEYAKRLQDAAERMRDRLFVVMRVYFEKPRT
ncbi:MAG: 3-deoxy-7-phosphoheptulonate synthase, partial [Acidimicrobiales bacterium]